jgi:Bifunctional DNA primase/polymerase, N-terminal/Domain of unknown function (DUF927)
MPQFLSQQPSADQRPGNYAILDVALALLRAGLSVIPIRADGSKAPVVQWEPYKFERASEDQAKAWWSDGQYGIAVVCGAVSGNAECIDIDRGALVTPWSDLVESQAPGLTARLCGIRTPRDGSGCHVWYRCPSVTIPGSDKLARERGINPDTGKERLDTLIETRGEGGYALAPGSPPACHETGRPYEHVVGPPLHELPTISAAERQLLIDAARSFDRCGADNQQRPVNPESNGALRPGDDYDLRGPEWSAILGPHGWTLAHTRGDGALYWRRPDKGGPGWSATTGFCVGADGADLLYVFSSSAAPFEDRKSYGKFAAVALLDYGGDFSAAARALAQQGYGEPLNGRVRESSAAEPPLPSPLERLAEVLTEGAEKLFGDRVLLVALAHLAETDAAEFACRRAQMRSAGIKMRDLDAALAPVRHDIRAARPAPDACGAYRVAGGRIVHVRPTSAGTVEVPLCNFAARIVGEVVVDDGTEQQCTFAIEGALQDGTPLPRIEVSAEDFPAMRWPVRRWGTRAVVLAGASTSDHLRCSLQLLSGEVPRSTVYAHTGWRRVGEWLFLYAGGAIGQHGNTTVVQVPLSGKLAQYQLPDPPDGQALVDAVRASLAIHEVARITVTASLMAAVYRSALDSCDFALHLAGRTGLGKTELVALCQQHFGAGMDARNLPGSWSSTANSLESLAFHAKDALLVVDDFAPGGSVGNVDRLNREADRLIRAQGNNSGRGRCRPDGTLRPDKPPRGLILSTGEDVPRGQSLRARLWVLEVAPDDVNWTQLTIAQGHAASGVYAAAMSGYLRWLAPRIEIIRRERLAEVAKLRDELRADAQHARTPGIAADLLYGFRLFLDFAREVGAVTVVGHALTLARVRQAIVAVARTQHEHVQEAEPTEQFLRLLVASMSAGRCHVRDPNGFPPGDARAWGEGRGSCIGWLDRDDLYLEPEASYAAAQAMARDQGGALPVGPQTLRKRLDDRGLIVQKEPGKLTVRRMLGGRRVAVIYLRVATLYPPEPGQPGQPADGWGVGPPAPIAPPISDIGARGEGLFNGVVAGGRCGYFGPPPSAISPGEPGQSGQQRHTTDERAPT